MINSFHTLFAGKASCTFGVGDPGNTAIKTEIVHDPDLNMEPLGSNLLKTNGKLGRYSSSHMLVSDRGVSNKLIMIKVGNRNWVGQAPCQCLYKI